MSSAPNDRSDSGTRTRISRRPAPSRAPPARVRRTRRRTRPTAAAAHTRPDCRAADRALTRNAQAATHARTANAIARCERSRVSSAQRPAPARRFLLGGFGIVPERVQDPRDDERDDRRQAEAETRDGQRDDEIVDADRTKYRPDDDRRARDEERPADPREAARDLRQRPVVLQTRFSGRFISMLQHDRGGADRGRGRNR